MLALSIWKVMTPGQFVIRFCKLIFFLLNQK